MFPDAGGTDQVIQNRGYVAIPEVGDQVMVGFVHNHPDRPFVMGGMFHGQVGLGGGSDNRVKSIQTRSGHRIIFTEDESIVITGKSGNEIHLDTTGSNISITAPETMTLNCKNMNIEEVLENAKASGIKGITEFLTLNANDLSFSTGNINDSKLKKYEIIRVSQKILNKILSGRIRKYEQLIKQIDLQEKADRMEWIKAKTKPYISSEK